MYARRFATLFLVLVITGIWITPAGLGQTATSDIQKKVPPAVVAMLTAGQAEDVIVLFDSTKVEREAEEMRRDAGMTINSEVVIDFKSAEFGVIKQNLMSAISSTGVSALRDYSHLPMSFLRVPSPEALTALAERPEVVAVYVNEKRYPTLTQSLPLIGQPAVQALGHTGAGTTVAVLDTGVDYTRAAFGSCAAAGDPGCAVVYAQDFAPDDATPDAHNPGHGTNVAATTLGVAPSAEIAALDVFDGGGASDSDILAAVNWCIANRATYNIVAMNMSLGGGLTASECPDSPYASGFAQAREAGLLPVVSSGNDAQSAQMSSPACVPGAVRVGAVYDSDVNPVGNPVTWGSGTAHECTDSSTAADQVTCFSNATNFLTILAPGAMTTAAGITMGGTSQAAPHVAGAVAVIKGIDGTISSDNVVASMTSSGVTVNDGRNGLNFPRLNLQAAATVALSNQPPNTPSGPTPNNGTTDAPLAQVLSWTGGDPDVGDTLTYDVYLGQTTNPSLVSDDQSGTTYDPGGLAAGTYFWRVVAQDDSGYTTEGPLWSFTTNTDNCTTSVIADGGFELGLGTTPWVEYSSNIGSSICDSARCGTDRSRSGSWWAWFGTSAGDELDYVEQDVYLAEGSATLNFYLWIRFSSNNGLDHLRVFVDNNEVIDIVENNATYQSAYALAQVDISAYADGGSHRIRFQYDQTDATPDYSNFHLDDISIENCFFTSELDELAVDFGSNGLFRYDGAWGNLTSWDSEMMTAWQNKLAIDFGPNGLYLYDLGGFTRISTQSPTVVAPYGDKLAVNLPGQGLFLYDGTWENLTSWEAEQMVTVGSALMVDFGANGLFSYDAGWTSLSAWDPASMVAWGTKLAVVFAGQGLYTYESGTWARLTTWEPEQMAAWDTTLVLDFGTGRGLYTYNGSWTRLSTWDPETVLPWSTKLIIDFGPLGGIYTYETGTWARLSSWDPVEIDVMNGKLAIAFGAGRGLYTYDSSWTRLSTWDPEQMEPINVQP